MDTVDTASPPQLKKPGQQSRSQSWRAILRWLAVWEIYPILAIAIFLRFYHLSFTELDSDQSVLWSLSRAALTHGLIPATSNMASVGYANPPDFVYALMVVSAFTANPLAGAILIAFMNVLAVALTYVFTRRYYGRLAGTFAAALCASAFQAVHYSRFIWQPNLLPFFALLFIMALFWGAVERRPGWFAVALPLLGFLLQLHLLTIYLLVPLVIAMALAYKTIRWRDVVVGTFLFLLLCSTYLIWEFAVHFADMSILLNTLHEPSRIDSQALRFYLDLLGPSTNSTAPLALTPLLPWVTGVLIVLLLGGFLLAVAGLFGWKRVQVMAHPRFPEDQPYSPIAPSLPLWKKLWTWWNAFAASPQRSGLLLLLAWQIAPLVFMSRHTVDLQLHYLLYLLPGPFILIGLFLSQAMSWVGTLTISGKLLLRLAFPALVALLVVAQFFNTTAWLVGTSDGSGPNGVHFDTAQDLQAALTQADQLAQTHHFHHVYIDTDQHTYAALTYLSGQMQTPHTVLSGSHCLLLPDLEQGPAVMLLGPADTLDMALLTHFASVTLVSEPSRLGGPPFHLYIVQPLATTPGSVSFANALAVDKGQPASFNWNDPGQPTSSTEHLLTTLWTNLQQLPEVYSTTYTYRLRANYTGNGTDGQTSAVDCTFTSLAPGEHLLVPFQLPTAATLLPASLAITGSTWIDQPYEKSYGPFHLLSVQQQSSLLATLRSTTGTASLIVHNE